MNSKSFKRVVKYYESRNTPMARYKAYHMKRHLYLKHLKNHFVIFAYTKPAPVNFEPIDCVYKHRVYVYYKNTAKMKHEHEGETFLDGSVNPDIFVKVPIDDRIGTFSTGLIEDPYDDFLFTKPQARAFAEKSSHPKILKRDTLPAKYAHPNDHFLDHEQIFSI